MTNKQSQSGFTLTELMLAMTFITFLLIFGVTVIMQTLQIYTKGVQLRQITQSGRQIGDDIAQNLRYARSQSFTGVANLPAQRLCANGISYVWNIGDAAPASQRNKYTTGEVLRFARIPDPSGTICSTIPANPSGPLPLINRSSYPGIREQLTDQLAVRCFTVGARENNKIVTVNMILSTAGSNSPVSVASPGANTYQCAGAGIECPTGINGAYCAIGQFEPTAYLRN